MLYRLRRFARVRALLSRGRLHVLGARRRSSPFGRIEVDPVLCIGCKKCVSKGPDGAFLDGCPWDAIEMVAIEEVEAMIGMKMPV